MAQTKIADLIKHDEFAQYFAQAMLDRSTLFKSGIAVPDPAIAERCNAAGAGGDFVHLPFFNELGNGGSYEAERMVEEQAATPDKITAGKDVAVICNRIKAFGSTDIAAFQSGADPMKAIAEGLVDWWNKEHNVRLIATINGALGAMTGANTHTLDISAEDGTARILTGDAMLDAAQLLGDQKTALTAYAMSSASETHLQKLEGTQLFKPSETPAFLKTYNGRAVIIDDNIPNGVVFIFAAGAVAFNECPYAPDTPKFEPYREELKSQGGIVTRDRSIIHVRGVKWNKTDTNPANAKTGTAGQTGYVPGLSDSGNWALAYPAKAVRVAKLVASLTPGS